MLTVHRPHGAGEGSVTIDFSVEALGHLKVDVHRLPRGTTLTLGETIYEIAGGDSAEAKPFHVDVRGAFAELPLRSFEDGSLKHDFGLTLTVQLPGYEPLREALPPLQLTAGFTKWLETVEGGPLIFEGEAVEEAKAGSQPVGVHCNEYGVVSGVYGTGETLRDVDRIAVAHFGGGKETKLCKGYTLGDIELSLTSTHVTIYERRTGATLATKEFKAYAKCPSHATVNHDNQGMAYADQAEIRKWLKAKIR